MARYDYRCTKCNRTFEVEHPMGESPNILCPECKAPATNVFSVSGISFHGSGFYNTDQRDTCHASEKASCEACPHHKK